MKVLIVEDEVSLLSTMVDFFQKEKYIAIGARNLFIAEDKLLMHQFDVVVLDITLPDGNGLDLIKRIHKTQENCGVLIVSAKNSLTDKITGLDYGADDYITKPFHLTEIHARVRAICRRNTSISDDSLTFNELDINMNTNQFQVHQKVVELTNKEFQLIWFFIVNKNRVITKEGIVQHLWGDGIELSDNFDFIYTHIKNLRKKIVDAKGADYLKTVYGLGYKFTDQ
jgi:DNA-binding response OmpR family regulator